MCTVSIFKDKNSISVFMNRDESISRSESPPSWNSNNILCPTDSKKGGTWIAVNKESNWGCLLNHYPEIELPELEFRSRGEILPKSLNTNDHKKALKELNLSSYRPFKLILGSKTNFSTYIWDFNPNNNIKIEKTSSISETEDKQIYLISSSSFKEEEAKKFRKKQFDDWHTDSQEFIDGFPSFHLSAAGDSYLGILVKREKSETKSIISLKLNNPELNNTEQQTDPVMNYRKVANTTNNTTKKTMRSASSG